MDKKEYRPAPPSRSARSLAVAEQRFVAYALATAFLNLA